MPDAINDVKERLITLWERIAEERGFGMLFGRILATLYFSDVPLSQKQLSEKTKFSISAVSKILDQLTALGSVQKFKKESERTYYYKNLISPADTLVTSLGRWIESQKIMGREISTLIERLKSADLNGKEKQEAQRLLIILEKIILVINEMEKIYMELKKRMLSL